MISLAMKIIKRKPDQSLKKMHSSCLNKSFFIARLKKERKKEFSLLFLFILVYMYNIEFSYPGIIRMLIN